MYSTIYVGFQLAIAVAIYSVVFSVNKVTNNDRAHQVPASPAYNEFWAGPIDLLMKLKAFDQMMTMTKRIGGLAEREVTVYTNFSRVTEEPAIGSRWAATG